MEIPFLFLKWEKYGRDASVLSEKTHVFKNLGAWYLDVLNKHL